MKRRLPLLVLLVLSALVVGWLWTRGDGKGGRSDVVTRDEGQEAAPETLEHPTEQPPSLAGTSDAELPPADPGTVGPVRVRLLGRGGVPVPDFPLVVIGPGGEVPHVLFTGAEGEATFPDLPYDGTHAVATLAFKEKFGLQVAERVPVRGPEIVLRSDLGLPCEVVVTDAESGRVLSDVGWSLYPWEAFVDGGTVPLRTGRRPIVAAPGGSFVYQLRVAVPEGYVAWSLGKPHLEISRYATALRYVYPLHREADVVVDLLEHDGSPARDPWIISWTLAGKERAPLLGTADTEALALNRLRLRGVPYVAGAMLRLRVGVEEVDDHRVVLAAVRLAQPTRLVVRLPHPDGYEPPDAPFQMPGESVIGVGGRADEVVVSPPRGTLDLQVLRRDGKPAAHATVSLQYLEEGHRSRGGDWELDAEGRRLVERLYEGTWRVRIHEPGLVQTAQVCEITATETTRVRLREGNGGTVRLRVVDPAGRPLPFAKFRLRDWMWRDLEDGVQRVDPYVDADGTRTLHHVSPDMDLDVLAWYAGGRGTTEVRVDEGETIDVTVEVTPAE